MPLTEAPTNGLTGHIADHASLKDDYDQRHPGAPLPVYTSLIYRGVNLSGAEFTEDAAHLPGTVDTDYMYPSAGIYAAMAGKGHRAIRLPFRWERIQPTRGAALNSAELTRLVGAVNAAGAVGLKVLLDCHNYGRYINSTANGGATLVLGDGTLTTANFVDLWTRLSTAFKGNGAVLGYGLMNEPHDLPGGAAAWEAASQSAVTAIRANADTTQVFVSGYSWSGAQSWAAQHPAPWITDSTGRITYEAHYYFDMDNSGSYAQSYADANTAAVAAGFTSLLNRATTQVSVFANWCVNYAVSGFIGEMGWPNTGDATAWNAAGEAVYGILDAARIGATYWAAGEWYGTGYPLSVYTGSSLTTEATQAQIVQAHPSINGTTPLIHMRIHQLLHIDFVEQTGDSLPVDKPVTGHLGHTSQLHARYNVLHGPGTVDLTPRAVALAPVVVAPVAGGVVSLARAVPFVAAVPVVPVPQSVTINLTPEVSAATPVAVSPQAQSSAVFGGNFGGTF